MALVTDLSPKDEILLDGGRVTVRVIQVRSGGKIRLGIQAGADTAIVIKKFNHLQRQDDVS